MTKCHTTDTQRSVDGAGRVLTDQERRDAVRFCRVNGSRLWAEIAGYKAVIAAYVDRTDELCDAEEERDAAIARAEAAERVVADLAEDIERRLVMGVGTISSQHVLRRLGRPWTFEEVSRTLLHDAARTREDQP